MRQYRITNNQAADSARKQLSSAASGATASALDGSALGEVEVISKNRSYGNERVEDLRQGEDYVVTVAGKPTNMTLRDIPRFLIEEVGIKDSENVNSLYEGIINRGFGGDEITGRSAMATSEKERKAQEKYLMEQLMMANSGSQGYKGTDSNLRGSSATMTKKNIAEALRAVRQGRVVDPALETGGRSTFKPKVEEAGGANVTRNSTGLQDRFKDEGEVAKRILAGLAGYGGGASRPASSRELTPAERKLRASLGL